MTVLRLHDAMLLDKKADSLRHSFTRGLTSCIATQDKTNPARVLSALCKCYEPKNDSMSRHKQSNLMSAIGIFTFNDAVMNSNPSQLAHVLLKSLPKTDLSAP